ncbi:co-chaperone YbbN [Sporosarcina pasteurii]|uniref:Thioredoxin n=1 Tax=Sporosarcina pasteurii TaxID=1474 RepID=A0A380CAM0_SPOPA|nr:thioredoxin family protein [Sporosarcina pasteurii]MDS9472645.1 thioredoxin family protein [Sporosarcina pasteurii]QBQ04306.1 thioredoxin [Sporosarcina pasteurii]SUJ16559.1 Thioredoxin [Sporosarcina pasteurii]
MKKLLTIGGIIVVIFVLILVLNNQSNKDKLKDNPYGTNKLEQATIDLIGDKNYSNIILPEDLKAKIESGEPVTAYFFSPLCGYCKEMTPVMMPIAKDMGVEVDQFNTLEFNEDAQTYNIEATPTMIYFENGKEVGRMVGGQPEENIRAFFDAVKGETK